MPLITNRPAKNRRTRLRWRRSSESIRLERQAHNARTEMGDTGPARTSTPLGIVAIAMIVLGVAAVGYLVTTFLFAFSGGQYRMVAVVNLGAVAVISLGVLVAAVTWIVRSSAEAIRWTVIATGGGWVAALIAEWLISFSLGAG